MPGRRQRRTAAHAIDALRTQFQWSDLYAAASSVASTSTLIVVGYNTKSGLADVGAARGVGGIVGREKGREHG